MDVKQYMTGLGRDARIASRDVAASSTAVRNQALLATREVLARRRQSLVDANREDLVRARENDLAPALVDRLELTPARLDAMLEGLTQVAALADPLGSISTMHTMPSGISVGQMRVPLGVVGIIYESRPNVTVEAASLCLKAGNAAILRGGSEALASNRVIAACVEEGVRIAGLPAAAIQVVDTADREAVGALITMSEFVDVIVPRGGKGLIERVSREARVPVIKHLDGVCHVYIDDSADPEMARAIALNAKTQRYGTCNTMETLLVAAGCAEQILPAVAADLAAAGVELRGCPRSRDLVPAMAPASDADWETEYLAPVLSIRVVGGLEQAIDHINTHGSGHTDAIVTGSHERAMLFLRRVDSSSVMVNASTRFADGFEYGLGAEIGISTDKLHARGPVGLEGLTSQKYIVLGSGQIRN